ncbi:Txe/YoeB family addiction module toxin [bacterium]|nr:Txe/YoeB family addiction module toxin [FCB group bacterium]MBL7191976.1 Txe/YoeB family addiction module toxin [bacterium]
MRNVIFERNAFKDIEYWLQNDRRILRRILVLIRDIDRNPFSGLGKPEPLRYDFKGCWSRRIDEEHRLIYIISDDNINILSCKYHYK